MKRWLSLALVSVLMLGLSVTAAAVLQAGFTDSESNLVSDSEDDSFLLDLCGENGRGARPLFVIRRGASEGKSILYIRFSSSESLAFIPDTEEYSVKRDSNSITVYRADILPCCRRGFYQGADMNAVISLAQEEGFEVVPVFGEGGALVEDAVFSSGGAHTLCSQSRQGRVQGPVALSVSGGYADYFASRGCRRALLAPWLSPGTRARLTAVLCEHGLAVIG